MLRPILAETDFFWKLRLRFFAYGGTSSLVQRAGW